jgi:hypothetical protein
MVTRRRVIAADEQPAAQAPQRAIAISAGTASVSRVIVLPMMIG